MKPKCLLAHTVYWLPRIIAVAFVSFLVGLLLLLIGSLMYTHGWTILPKAIGMMILIVAGAGAFIGLMVAGVELYEWAESYRKDC